jgi:hypothetical protein
VVPTPIIAQMPLDLVVPDLLLPADAPRALRELRLPWAERALARADRERVAIRGLDAWLARAFAVAEPLPVAAVTLAGDDAPRAGTWLRADPVHLHVGQDAVALHDAAILGVTRDEAAALVAALQSLFGADGLEFLAPVPERWYVRVPEGEMPGTTPLDEAIGRNVFGLLPRGAGRINWGAAITEAQMVLSAHPVNAARAAAGRPAINSVWFWGGGATPANPVSSYALVHAGNAFARGLGKLSGTRTVPAGAGFAQIDAVRPDEWVLVVEERLTRALRSGGEDAWVRAAQTLDTEWFAGLGAAAERFEGVRLVLPSARDTLVATLTPRSRWRWWRARRPLATHA